MSDESVAARIEELGTEEWDLLRRSAETVKHYEQ